METESLYNEATSRWGFVPDVLDCGLGPTMFAVYAALCIYANKDGAAFPAYRTLAEKFSISPDTVQRAIEALEKKGLILVKRPAHQGRGQFNRYVIVDRVDKKGGTHAPLSTGRGAEGGQTPPKKGGTTGTESVSENSITEGQQNSFQESAPSEGTLKALADCRAALVSKGLVHS